MAFLLGLAVAASFGSGDFISGIAARRMRTPVVVTTSQLGGLVPLGILIAVTDRTVAPAGDLLLGVFGGVALPLGITCLVRGLAIGRMSVVAPTAASVGAVVGVVYGLVSGERPAVVAILGVALAIVAVILIAHVAEHHESDDAAPRAHARRTVASRTHEVLLGVGAGLFLGTVQVFFAATSDDAGFWPVLVTRGTAGVLVAIFLLARIRHDGRPAPLSGGDVLLLGAYAVLDTAGSALMIEAFRQGLVSLVVPVAALYPAATVLLARFILKDRMNRGQVVGFGLAAAGLVLIGVGR